MADTGYPDGENPFQAPLAASDAPAFVPLDRVRNGPPWERADQSLVDRFTETNWQNCTSPSEFFADMRREGGWNAPLLYALIGGTIGGIAGTLIQMFLHTMLSGGGLWRLESREGMDAFVTILIAAPIGALVNVFLWSGVYHLLLRVLGGAHFPFETTLRVVCYASGSTAFLLMVPWCGQFIYLLVWLSLIGIGLARAQEIGSLKATAVTLLPMVLCFGLVFVGTIIALVLFDTSGFD